MWPNNRVLGFMIGVGLLTGGWVTSAVSQSPPTLPGLPPLPTVPTSPAGARPALPSKSTPLVPQADASPVAVVEITAGGQTQVLTVSNRDLNHIEVPVDITEVLTSKPIETKILGRNLFFHYTRTSPAELFIVTARGTYTVLLQPQPVSARRIVLRDQAVKRDAEHHTEAKEPYLQRLKSLMAAMVQQQDLTGYTTKTVEEPIEFPGCRGLRTKIYAGSQLLGSIYVLENATAEPLTLREADFYRPGVLSVMVDNPQLLPLSPVTERTWQSLTHVFVIERRS